MRTVNTDLVWWRHGGGMQTAVTLHPGMLPAPLPAGSICRLTVYGDAGSEVWATDRELATAGFDVYLSSELATRAHAEHCELPAEGILRVELQVPDDSDATPSDLFSRLYSVVDWFDGEGDLACLHNDQSLSDSDIPIELTEIVLTFSPDVEPSLVFLNGPHVASDQEIELRLGNRAGESRRVCVPMDPMPFAVQKIYLRDYVSDLDAFAHGQAVVMDGRCPAAGRFLRPYVVEEGRRFCAYHGGNRYEWRAFPALLYGILENGEVNPFAVIVDEQLETIANVLNSHGDIERDYWVGVRLYDADGTLVADRDRWLLAQRHGLGRGRFADLLAVEREGPFVGHAVMYFSHDPEVASYPRRLQVLAEYAGTDVVSRVMFWSDQWNSPDRVMLRGRYTYTGWQRAWCDDRLSTTVIVGNTSTSAAYDHSVEADVTLTNRDGDVLEQSVTIPAQGTCEFAIASLFPEAIRHLAPTGVGLVQVSSVYDLSKLQYTVHRHSGAISFEHFMARSFRDGDREITSVGS